MRRSGKIRSWNEDRAFGFIRPGAGGQDVFLHKTGLSNGSRTPVVGQRVTYSLSTDTQGRPCAQLALLPGDRFRVQKATGGKTTANFVALAFLSFVALLVFVKTLPPLVLVVYLVLSCVTFFAYAFDKTAAKDGDWRTPEKKLHLLSLIGGWPGALVAQQALRHKSRKTSFLRVFWFTVMVNCGAFIWVLTPDGSSVLQSWLDEIKSSAGLGPRATIEWAEPR